jgi:hypothetical protein
MATDHTHRWSDDQLQEFYDDFKAHRKQEEDMWAHVLSGFPNEDPLKHRLYHEAAMRAAEAQERFWNELRLDVAKKSAWGVLVLIVALLLAGLSAKFGLGVKL